MDDYLARKFGPEDQLMTEEPALDTVPPFTPAERLSIVDRLANLSGPDSQAFFAAHGLGRAYDSVGKGASKKGHINAALAEAERRKTIDGILHEARAYLQPSSTDLTPPTGWSSTPPQVGPAPHSEGIELPDLNLFISHAYANKELATALKQALILGGVPNNRIFFSSQRSTGIPAGKDVRQHLREQLAGAGLVIELLTPEFMLRPMCLLELGAAWGLEKPTFPVVVPPLSISDAKKAIGDVIMGEFGSDEEIEDVFGDLSDRIGRDLQLDIRRQDLAESLRFFKTHFRALP